MLRRRLLLSLLAAPLAARANVEAEAGLRSAFAAYVRAWNARDSAALERLLVEDVEWVSLYAQPRTGRARVIAYTDTAMPLYALKFGVMRIRPEGAGRATLLFRGQILEYPVKDGRYTRVYNRDLLASRWRLESGEWRIEYLNENATESESVARRAGLR